MYHRPEGTTARWFAAITVLCSVVAISIVATRQAIAAGPNPFGASTASGSATDSSGVVRTWGPLAGTDDLGRTLPSSQSVGPPKPDHKVGVLYEPWHGQNNPRDYQNIVNLDKVLAADPHAPSKPSDPAWPGAGHFAYWDEPLFGYYSSDDPWVVQRHLEMLADAGIDFLEIDASNNLVFKPEAELIMRTIAQMQREGKAAPQVTFMTRTNSSQVMDDIYRAFYAPSSPYRYPSTWFRWKGKPLIIGINPSSTVASFFTVRYAQWPNEPAQKCDGWDWESFDRPQRVNYSCDGHKEQMSVSVAQNSGNPPIFSFTDYYGVGGSWSRNYHDGAEDNSAGAVDRGYNFQEEWDNVLAQDPEVVTLEGFDEWDAGNWQDEAETGPLTFYDLSSERYSRDTEPMTGGYGDDYYMQLIEDIRRYKGVEAPVQPSPATTISIDRGFDQWNDVSPGYLSYTSGPTRRDYPGLDNKTYINDTARNTFAELKVARDASNLYFYARTTRPITPRRDKNWMTLFLDTDGNGSNGWKGFDYAINLAGASSATTTLRKSTSGWNWELVSSSIAYRIQGDEMMIAVPRALLGQQTDPVKLDFKWADNWQHDGDIIDFYQDGTTAPYGRLSYVYDASSTTATAQEPTPPAASPLPAGAAPRRIEDSDPLVEYNDYSGTAQNWISHSDSAASGGSYVSVTSRPDQQGSYYINTASAAFYGTGISWLSRRAPDGDPQAEVFIDGRSQGYVSLAGPIENAAPVFTKYGLSPGRHHVLVKCLNIPGTTCYHDAFQSFGGASGPTATPGDDLALTASASASSFRPARWYATDPGQVNDGDGMTAWQADGTTGQFIALDFGSPTRFNTAAITGDPAVDAYDIQYWTNGWHTVYRGGTMSAHQVDVFGSVVAQKVRLLIRSADSPPRIAELGIFAGKPRTNPRSGTLVSQGKPVSASSTGPDCAATAAVDGQSETRWCPAPDASLPQWITIDLGEPTTLTQVRTRFGGVANWTYWIEASNDASSWVHLVTSSGVTGQSYPDSVHGSFRYVRIQIRGTTASTPAINAVDIYADR